MSIRLGSIDTLNFKTTFVQSGFTDVQMSFYENFIQSLVKP